jgi:predicted CopG family antitoxin
MVKPVSLSDPAFEALRAEKRENESDSDVVLRLIREVQRTRKDPYHFVRSRDSRERTLSPSEHERAFERMYEADRAKAQQRWEDRDGGA